MRPRSSGEFPEIRAGRSSPSESWPDAGQKAHAMRREASAPSFRVANLSGLAHPVRRHGQAMGKQLASSRFPSFGSGRPVPVPPRRRGSRRPVASRVMQFAGNGGEPTEGKLRSYADELASPRRFSTGLERRFAGGLVRWIVQGWWQTGSPLGRAAWPRWR